MKPVVSNRLALDMNGMLVLFSVSTLSSPDLILTICPSFNMFPIPEITSRNYIVENDL